MNKTDLEALVQIRIREAHTLLDAGQYQGAYYLAGYAVECALKSCIAKTVQQFDFPNKQLANASHTHNLSALLKVAGLEQYLSEKEQQDEDFRVNWAIVKDWSEASRYERDITESRAREVFTAITDENSGILPWLTNYM